MTVRTIEADGFEIGDQVETLLTSDSPVSIGKSMGMGTIGFAQAYARIPLDILVVLGDRFEMHSAALAALPFKIPVAHIHGGEITEGAIDDALRHSITKLSHLHFVATNEYARRVVQLGENPWRITVSGALGLDNLRQSKLFTTEEFELQFGFHLESSPLIVTFHPVTLEYEHTEWHMQELLTALDNFEIPVVFTMPNADTGGRIIRNMITQYVQRQPSAYVIENLGTQGYFSLMALAEAMVGNSSSGIIEAASFELPVVNIGNRQQGRIRGANVIDVGYKRESINEGLTQALDPQFRLKLRGIFNPYGSGISSEKIVDTLKHVQLDERLVKKSFQDVNLEYSPGTESYE